MDVLLVFLFNALRAFLINVSAQVVAMELYDRKKKAPTKVAKHRHVRHFK